MIGSWSMHMDVLCILCKTFSNKAYTTHYSFRQALYVFSCKQKIMTHTHTCTHAHKHTHTCMHIICMWCVYAYVPVYGCACVLEVFMYLHLQILYSCHNHYRFVGIQRLKIRRSLLSPIHHLEKGATPTSCR